MKEEQAKEPVKRNKQGYIVEDLTKWKPRFIGEIDPSTLPEKDSVKAEKKRMQTQIDKLTNDIEEQAASFLILLKGARNAALSEAIEKIQERLMSGDEMYPSYYLEILEGLKIKP